LSKSDFFVVMVIFKYGCPDLPSTSLILWCFAYNLCITFLEYGCYGSFCLGLLNSLVDLFVISFFEPTYL
jgi:hypothetical protein